MEAVAGGGECSRCCAGPLKDEEAGTLAGAALVPGSTEDSFSVSESPSTSL